MQRAARVIMILGYAVLAATVVAALMTSDPEALHHIDNIHWTASYCGAGLVGLIGWWTAAPEDRELRGWLAANVATAGFGQIVWDLQGNIGWTPEFAPSEPFFMVAAYFGAFGLIRALHRKVPAEERGALWLDMLILSTAILSIAFALYLPHRAQIPNLQIFTMAGYMFGLLGITSAALSWLTRMPGAPSAAIIAFIVGEGFGTLVWMYWNAVVLDQSIAVARWPNFALSCAILLLGWGSANLTYNSPASARWAAFWRGWLTLQPMIMVVVAAGAAAAMMIATDLPLAARYSIGAGSLVVVVLAMFRQSVVLREREQAMRAAEAANRAKSEFLANMSHEIRTPVTGIVGMLDLAHERRMDHELRELLGAASGAARHLVEIINDLLDLSRLEAGKVVATPAAVEIGPMINDLAASLRGQASGKGLSLICERPDEPVPPVMLDGKLFRQILFNLLGNAIKFTARGEVRISWRFTPNSEGGGRLQVKVADTGIGIAQADIARIFGRFEQAETALNRRHEGTGLGLAISQDLARLLNGRIGLVSTPGEGSTFSFSCDCVVADPSHMATPQENVISLKSEPLRILVVDDNPVNRLLMRKLVEADGHQAGEASGGAAAIEAVRANLLDGSDNQIDTILMDIQMPDMDGIEATRRIKALHPRLARLPVIAVTANAGAGQRDAYLAAGLDGYVTKPIDRARLSSEIRRLTGHGPATSRPAASLETPPPPPVTAASALDDLLADL